MPTPPPRPADKIQDLRQNIPALDGVRGVAILLVFLIHGAQESPAERLGAADGLFYEIMRFGWSGVDLFFVLSGFLITGILLDQRAKFTGGFRAYFANFYARRSLRIFPLYYASLILFLFVAPRVSADFAGIDLLSWRTWAYLLYLQNYLPFTEDIKLATHFWSLGVEEQFYLVWPFVVYAVPRKHLGKLILACLALALGLRILCEFALESWNVYRYTPTRADTLLFGALLAWQVREKAPPPNFVRASSLWILAAALALALLIGLSGGTDQNAPLIRTLGFTLTAFAYYHFARITLADRPHSLGQRLLESRPLRFTGKISYGLYVFHYPVILVLQRYWPVTGGYILTTLLFTLGTLAATTAIAYASWRAFELPFLKLKRHFYTPHKTDV